MILHRFKSFIDMLFRHGECFFYQSAQIKKACNKCNNIIDKQVIWLQTTIYESINTKLL